MNADDIAIRVQGLHKTFKLPHEKTNSIKGLVIRSWKRKKGYEKQNVLNDINFEIKKGEFFGIVGRNGSGKSTLLKLLAGVYTPDRGLIQINGSLTPFIELGVGFNPELTGRENVFLNGALLGFNRKEMSAMYDDIVAFAELERFMDQKLKNYSSGMQVRLAFSIAIRADSDILVLDEVLAVGDANFQQKCFEYFEKIKKEKRTIVLVTHDMAMVRRFCDRALLIEYGVQKSVGLPEEIASQYLLDNMNTEEAGKTKQNKKLGSQVKKLNIVPRSSRILKNSDTFTFDVEYELRDNLPVDLGIGVLYQNISLLEHNTKKIDVKHEANKTYTLTYRLPLAQFNPGTFRVDVAIFEKKEFKLIGFNTDSCSFIVKDEGAEVGGVLAQKGEWIVK